MDLTSERPLMATKTLFDLDEKIDPIEQCRGLVVNESILESARAVFAQIAEHPIDVQVEIINGLRMELHRISPFSAEPVDCVQWVKAETIVANDYNPNSVAPPEMRLLEVSISEDGYTQPIVSWVNGEHYEVVDGFHRNRVGRECKAVRERVLGYLPVTVVNSERLDRGDRIASTIRHNRARGKHKIGAMSDIVVELKRRNWSNEKIGRDLGMDPDEVLRLSQISGLAEMFADREFSEAWEADAISDDDNLSTDEEMP
jgi:ParB-like chromosome segregation protein Spo0J